MSVQAPDCPKCECPMEPGVLLDRGHYDSLGTAEWLEGNPEKSIWTGLKTKGKERLPVRTYRCPQCGYLESYASTA
ncbi:MAG TPA: PF20097 family protein [Gemmatimonadales bacterium]|nr:PF20097 family protein [Gemmatimonadales bacterium]